MSDSLESSASQVPDNTPSPPAQESPRSAHEKKVLRRRTIKFVSVFVISVFVMLAGYDLAKFTKANDWYLLQVASSTTWLLKWVGYSCTLGNSDRFRGKEAEIRASLDAWRHGQEPTVPPPAGTDVSPLTAWESWEYQAAGMRRSIAQAEADLQLAQQDTTSAEPERSQKIDAAKNKVMQLKQRETGPLVSFVFKPSVAMRLDDARKRLLALQQDTSPDLDGRAQRMTDAQAEVDQLQTDVAQAQNAPPPYSQNRHALGFNFIVIPDCGAVQSMAIFISAILAFPSRWWKRIAGMLVGLPVLFGVNSFRLAFLAVIGALDNGGKWFKFSHEYVWQGIYIVFVVALWMGWVEFLVRRRT